MTPILHEGIGPVFNFWEQTVGPYGLLYSEHSLAASRSPQLSAIFQCTGAVQLVWACELAAAHGFICRGWWEPLDLNQTDQWTKIMSWKWLRAAQSCRLGCHFSVVLAAPVILSTYRESFDSKLISAMSLNGGWSFSDGRFYSLSHRTGVKGQPLLDLCWFFKNCFSLCSKWKYCITRKRKSFRVCDVHDVFIYISFFNWQNVCLGSLYFPICGLFVLSLLFSCRADFPKRQKPAVQRLQTILCDILFIVLWCHVEVWCNWHTSKFARKLLNFWDSKCR